MLNLFIIMLSLINISEGKEYDLKTLLHLTKTRNVEIEIEKSKLGITESQIGKEKSSYFPKITGSVGSEHRKLENGSRDKKDAFIASLGLEMNLFKFGATSNSIEALRAKLKSQKNLLEYTQKDIERYLKGEFYTGLQFQEVLKLTEEEFSFNDELKRQVLRRFKQGLVGKADVLEIDMRYAKLKQKRLILQEELDHTKDNIRKLALLSHDHEIELAGELPHLHTEVELGELIMSSHLKNRDVLRSKIQMESVSSELKAARSKRWPELNIKGRYGKLGFDDQFTENKTEGVVGVYLDIPLFDGGIRSSEVAKTKARLREKKLRYEKYLRDVKIDVTHKFEKMQNIHRQVDLAEENVKNGKVYFKNVLKEYRRGVKNSLDLVSARDQLIDFMITLVSTKRDFMLAKMEVERISGISIKEVK